MPPSLWIKRNVQVWLISKALMNELSGVGDECERSVHQLFGGRVARYHMVISRV